MCAQCTGRCDKLGQWSEQGPVWLVQGWCGQCRDGGCGSFFDFPKMPISNFILDLERATKTPTP